MKRKFLLLCAIGMMAVSFASCGLSGNKTHEHTVEHAEAKVATCSEAGNIEYWYCTGCDDVWSDEALTQKISKDETAIAALAHNVAHVEAVEAGCHYAGNVEYWYCTNCNVAWTDEEQTQVTNLENVIIPATGSDLLVHMEAVEPGCHYNGNIEYWVCYECEQVWQDEDLTQLTNIKNVILPATGSELLVHMDAVAPACHYEGNIEYWVCYECEQVWADEALTQLTNIKNVILPALGGEVVHVAAVEPTSTTDGNIEYWYCEACEQVWQDEALTQLTNFKNVILPALGDQHVHNPIHMDAVEAGCHYNGNIEYWVCYECEQVWQDEALTQLTNIKNVILPATGSDLLVHTEAVAPACHYDGNIEYWVCYECEQVWQDEALTQLTNIKNVIIPALGGEVVHVDAVEAGCHYDGNIEYWACYECEQVWQNEALTQLTNIKNVIIPATGSDLLVHMDAVAPACHYEGNIEYWVCYECEQVWADANLTQLTNIKNVILPALGGDVVHVDAVESTCTTMGNIEYWYCEVCEQVWQNEALTQLTNFKNVKLGYSDHVYTYACDKNCAICYETTNPNATHTVVYVEAKESTCTASGNIEYWYCSDCGSAWADAEQTKVTNMMSVTLPTVEHTGYEEDFVCDVCSKVIEPADGTVLTLEQAIVLGKAVGSNKYTTNKYYITGTITSVYNTQYGNMYITNENGTEFTIYGVYNYDGSVRYDALSEKPSKGDELTVYGVIGNYNGAPQTKDSWLDDFIKHECSWSEATCIALKRCIYCDATEGELAEHNYVEGVCSVCGKVEGATEPTELVKFEFGANGTAAHVDGNDIGTAKTYTQDGYTLSLTGVSKVYDGSKDAKGNSCLKLGTSKVVGTFTFTVDSNVTKVIINVAQYKANSTKITINGTTYTITTASNNGAYTAIEIDTSTTKTITVSTVSGACRAMIDSIVFIG